MSEELGEVWRQWSPQEIMGRHGTMDKARALARVEASIGEGYHLVVVKPPAAWLRKPASPAEWFAQFDEPAPLLIAKRRGGDDKRPLATGPWAPDEWTALLASDPAIIEALKGGPKSVKEIGITVVLAGHGVIRPGTLRRHLKRLGYGMVGKTPSIRNHAGETIRSVPLWGRKT